MLQITSFAASRFAVCYPLWVVGRCLMRCSLPSLWSSRLTHSQCLFNFRRTLIRFPFENSSVSSNFVSILSDDYSISFDDSSILSDDNFVLSDDSSVSSETSFVMSNRRSIAFKVCIVPFNVSCHWYVWFRASIHPFTIFFKPYVVLELCS